MKCVVGLLLAVIICLCQGNEYQVEHLNGNQVLFRDVGILANRVSFCHIYFDIDFTEPMKQLDDMVAQVYEAYSAEMERFNQSFAPITSRQDISTVFGVEGVGPIYTERSLDGAYMLLSVMDNFMKYSRQLKDLLSAVPRNSSESQIDQFTHKKVKREILGAAALLLGVHNSLKISELEENLEALNSNFNTVVDSVELLNQKHTQLAVDVGVILRLTKSLFLSNRKVFSAAVTLLDSLRGTVDDITSIMTSGQRRRVSVRLINGEALNELFRAMKLRAASRGLEMILEQPSDVYDLESSYAYEPETLKFRIYIHFPFLYPADRLSLFEYLKFPLAESFAHNASITPVPKDIKYLGIIPSSDRSSPSASSKHKFRLLTHSELQACSRFRKYFFCSNRNVLRTDSDESCAVSLWLQDHNLIVKNCDMEITPFREHVAKVAQNQWVVMSPKPAQYPVVCGSRTLKPVHLSNQSMITLPEGCRIELERFVLSTDSNSYSEVTVQRFSWSFTGSVFDGIIEDRKDLNEMIQEIVRTRSKYGIADISGLKRQYKASPNLIKRLWDSITSLSIFSGLSNIFSLAFYVFIAWLIFIAYSRGWISWCFNLGRSKSKTETEFVVERPLRSSIRRSRPSPSKKIRVHRVPSDLESEVPPPYSSVMFEPSRSLRDEYHQDRHLAGRRDDSEDSVSIDIENPVATGYFQEKR